MEFKKYQHVEKFGNLEVRDIEKGKCYIFPKLDGTNASVWMGEDGKICAGSRRRHLTEFGKKDNAGFYQWAHGNDKLIALLAKYPDLRLFGEWLVPHTVKTYADDAWRKFYVFDVCKDLEEGFEYLNYEKYQTILEEFDIDYIKPLIAIRNPTYEELIDTLKMNTFLIKDGEGAGEGVVIKNYEYVNKFGRVTWAKIVTDEFKESHQRKPKIKLTENGMPEEELVNACCTEALIKKVYSKLENDDRGWNSKRIPELLNRVYYDLVNEELYNFIKKKKPTINFKTLFTLVVNKIKNTMSELF